MLRSGPEWDIIPCGSLSATELNHFLSTNVKLGRKMPENFSTQFEITHCYSNVMPQYFIQSQQQKNPCRTFINITSSSKLVPSPE